MFAFSPRVCNSTISTINIPFGVVSKCGKKFCNKNNWSDIHTTFFFFFFCMILMTVGRITRVCSNNTSVQSRPMTPVDLRTCIYNNMYYNIHLCTRTSRKFSQVPISLPLGTGMAIIVLGTGNIKTNLHKRTASCYIYVDD